MADDARRAFLHELIDDAGLFPPASLSMDAATAQHAGARGGPHAWIQGRFICPAGRLSELAGHLGLLDRWRVSVLLDAAALDVGLEATAALLDVERGRVQIELVETKLPVTDHESVGDLVEWVEGADLGALPFLEVDPEPGLDDDLEAIAGHAAGAKLRTGGPTEDHVPSPAAVAAFLDGCRRLGLRCKATAGLHHPFRHVDEETGFVQHGFVNVVGAAVLAREHDLGPDRLEEIVAEETPNAFQLSADRFRWRDLDAGPEAVRDARGSLLFSYGSCSFQEPVDDLLELGVL
ncbi:MAG TPA: hypothetical protein VF097_04930 [Actinomycetota bacterium]